MDGYIEANVGVKPLSVNAAYRGGRRFKTDEYKSYEKELLFSLPKRKLSLPPYKINIEFGLSNKMSDWDNYIKNFQDILQKKYSFNDRHIMEGHVKKVYVKKGEEYIKFKLESI